MTKIERLSVLKQIIRDNILAKADFGFWDGFESTSINEEFEVEYNGGILCMVKAYVSLEVIHSNITADHNEYPENGECKITIESIELLDSVYSTKNNHCSNITEALYKEYGQESPYVLWQKEQLKQLFENLTPQNN
jgi:hypothetical protein